MRIKGEASCVLIDAGVKGIRQIDSEMNTDEGQKRMESIRFGKRLGVQEPVVKLSHEGGNDGKKRTGWVNGPPTTLPAWNRTIF